MQAEMSGDALPVVAGRRRCIASVRHRAGNAAPQPAVPAVRLPAVGERDLEARARPVPGRRARCCRHGRGPARRRWRGRGRCRPAALRPGRPGRDGRAPFPGRPGRYPRHGSRPCPASRRAPMVSRRTSAGLCAPPSSAWTAFRPRLTRMRNSWSGSASTSRPFGHARSRRRSSAWPARPRLSATSSTRRSSATSRRAGGASRARP